MLTITTPPPTIHSRNENTFALRVSATPQSFTVAAILDISEALPESFLSGWADYQAGRVVDMDRALGDEPAG